MRSSFFLLLITFLYSCKPSVKEATPVDVATPAVQVDSVEQMTIEQDQFEAEIRRFEQLDSLNGFCEACLLFTGSSSIRLWANLEDHMEGYEAMNRGFGGATIPEVLQYADRYLWKHQPEGIVFYCGENDISEGQSSEVVFSHFQQFVRQVEQHWPGIKMVYISMKPSPARWQLWPKYQQAEAMIRPFVESKPNLHYMDSSLSILGNDGKPKPDVFIQDSLHMNTKGYAEWTSQLRPILETAF